MFVTREAVAAFEPVAEVQKARSVRIAVPSEPSRSLTQLVLREAKSTRSENFCFGLMTVCAAVSVLPSLFLVPALADAWPAIATTLNRLIA